MATQIKELVYPSVGTVPYLNIHSRASWGAIFAGAIVALACLLALGALGFGFGLLSPAESGITYRAVLWWGIASLLSFYAGGWFSGRLTGLGRVSESVVHGVAAWGITAAAVALAMALGAGKAVGGVSGLLGGGLSGAFGGGPYVIEGVRTQQAPVTIQEKVTEVTRLARLQEAIAARPPLGGAQPPLRDAPGSAARGMQHRATTVQAIGLIGFFLMLLQVVSAAYGARMGTRVLKPSVPTR